MLQRLLVLFAALSLAQSFQLNFFRTVDNQIIEKCLILSELTRQDLDKLTADSQGCPNAFETSIAGRCYHECLIEELGARKDDGTIDLQKVNGVLKWLKLSFIQMVYDSCVAKFKDSTDECTGFYIHKCMNVQFGVYPEKSLHVPIFNVPEEAVTECKAEENVTDAELCDFEKDLETDQFAINEKARCYHVCLLKKLGFIVNDEVDVEAVVRRFNYYFSREEVLSKYETCKVEVSGFTGRCEMFYQLDKCLKRETEEFPPPAKLY